MIGMLVRLRQVQLAPMRLTRRPTVAAAASIAALAWLATVVPHQPPPAFSGHRALPPAIASGPPAAGERVVTRIVDRPHAASERGSSTSAGSIGPIAVDNIDLLSTNRCKGVHRYGNLRVVAPPAASDSIWSQPAGLVNSDAGSVGVSDDTSRTPYATVASTRGVAPVAFLAPGGTPGTVFASDGTALVRSIDGGCNWRPALSLDPSATAASLAATPSSGAVVSVAPGYVITALVARGMDVYATIAPPWWSATYAGVTDRAPLVLAASHDGGTTWSASVPTADQPVYANGSAVRAVSQPLPAGNGYPQLIAVAPADSRVIYLETAAHADATGADGPTRMRLFKSIDAGQTWHFVAAPVRPGRAGEATSMYAAGTPETYLFQLRVDVTRPDVLYGLGTIAAPGTVAPGANGLDGSDTQNGLFESDGTLYATSGSTPRWEALASPLGPTGYDGATMVYIDSYAAAASHDAEGRVAVVEHAINVAGRTLSYAVFTSSDGSRHWREMPAPSSLAVFLPAEDPPPVNLTDRPVGDGEAQLHQDGVYDASQPLWLSLLPHDSGLSLGVDPGPGVSWGSVSVYEWRWAQEREGWTRVGRGPVAPAVKADVRNWNFNATVPSVDAFGTTAYAVVQCRSAVNDSALATADASIGVVDAEADTYTGPIYLVSFTESVGMSWP